MRGEIFIASIVGLAAAITSISLAHTPQATPTASPAPDTAVAPKTTAAETITVTVPLADRVIQLQVPADKVSNQEELAKVTAELIGKKVTAPSSPGVVDVVLQTSKLTPVNNTKDVEG